MTKIEVQVQAQTSMGHSAGAEKYTDCTYAEE